MRRTIIAGNWKMNLDKKNVEELTAGIRKGLETKKTEHSILVFPSSIHLAYVSEQFKGTKVEVGVQNIYPSGLAAFTGETSTDQIKDYGIKTVLLGHSERRQFLGETDEFLNQKVKFCLEKGFLPMLCVGELLSEREANATMKVLERQIKEGLKGVSSADSSKVCIAYEPVWAIGTGKVATPEQAEEAHAFIRSELAKLFGRNESEEMSILYGGSVKPDNVKTLLEKPNVDGGLVGGASQKADSFLALL